jgi:LPXTG-motif cell wall-anchored protein
MLFLTLFAATALLVPSASAQDDDTEEEEQSACTYNNPNGCRLEYSSGGLPDTSPDQDLGDLSAAFADSGGPSADAIPAAPQPTPVPAAATTQDTQAPQLAFTGSETSVLAWVGAGLIGAGALALTARRRIEDC